VHGARGDAERRPRKASPGNRSRARSRRRARPARGNGCGRGRHYARAGKRVPEERDRQVREGGEGDRPQAGVAAPLYILLRISGTPRAGPGVIRGMGIALRFPYPKEMLMNVKFALTGLIVAALSAPAF